MEKDSLKTVVAFEGEKIESYIGTPDGKIEFLQQHDIFVKFKTNETIFYSSGVYQVYGGPPIIILPWFLKNPNSNSSERFQNVDALDFFDSLKEIKYFMSSLSELNTKGLRGSMKEITCHSFLKRMYDSLTFLLQENHFNESTDNVYYIKGRWNVAKDLMTSKRPTKFTCTFTDLGSQITEAEFAKSTCELFRKLLKSKKNKLLVDDTLTLLKDVDSLPVLTKRMLDVYRIKFESSNVSPEWMSYIDFVSEFVFQNEFISPLAGVAYRFKLDSFFEEIVSSILSKTEGNILLQKREDILGGSRWVSSDGIVLGTETEIKNAINKSIPDIVFTKKNHLSIVECKYKPLRVGFAKGETDKFLKRISREDRNQVLSFILSIKPDFDIRNKQVTFSVVYPSYHVANVEYSVLEFPFASFSLADGTKKVFQKRGIKGTEFSASLKVNFVAINIKTFLSELKNDGGKQFSHRLVNAITSQDMTKEQVLNPSSLPQKQFHRRLALTSIIVDKLCDDPNFGRVKHAKILYLVDARLNLKLEKKYFRDAAGPVNIESLKDDRFGVEPAAKKNSLFDATQVNGKDKRKVKYTPLRNLKGYIDLTIHEFDENIDEIYRIIDFFKPLTLEQSEIVSTLFACWNDLIIERNTLEISEELIFDEFLHKWHKSKERFKEKKNVLIVWLNRMKEKNIIPEGLGVHTIRLSS